MSSLQTYVPLFIVTLCNYKRDIPFTDLSLMWCVFTNINKSLLIFNAINFVCINAIFNLLLFVDYCLMKDRHDELHTYKDMSFIVKFLINMIKHCIPLCVLVQKSCENDMTSIDINEVTNYNIVLMTIWIVYCTKNGFNLSTIYYPLPSGIYAMLWVIGCVMYKCIGYLMNDICMNTNTLFVCSGSIGICITCLEYFKKVKYDKIKYETILLKAKD